MPAKPPYNLRNPWPQFMPGTRVKWSVMNLSGIVTEMWHTDPDKTGLIDTYVKVKWADGSIQAIHSGYLELDTDNG